MFDAGVWINGFLTQLCPMNPSSIHRLALNLQTPATPRKFRSHRKSREKQTTHRAYSTLYKLGKPLSHALMCI